MSPTSRGGSGKVIVIVLLAATSLVVVASYLLRDREEALVEGAPLLPTLSANAAELTRIEVMSGATSIVLVKDGDRWVVESSGRYPADVAAIRTLVSSLAELSRDEALTSRKERHGELGLAWPDAEGQAKLVRLVPGSQPPIEVVLGDAKFSPPSQYARLLGEDQTWRCKGTVTVETAAPRYMSATILALDGAASSDEVVAVRYAGLEITRAAPPEGATPPPTPQWEATLAAGPVDESFWPEAARTQAKSALPSWLARVEFDDVRLRGESWAPDPIYSADFETKRGTVHVQGMSDGEGLWVRLSAEPKPGASDETKDEKSKDWAAWSAEMAPWEFKLPAWKKSAFTRVRDAAKPPVSAPPAEGSTTPVPPPSGP